MQAIIYVVAAALNYGGKCCGTVGSLGTDKLVGVFAVRNGQDTDNKPRTAQNRNSPGGRLLPRLVSVIADDDLVAPRLRTPPDSLR